MNASQSERILVVDDSLATLEVLQRNLQAGGYAVFTATHVREALTTLQSQPVDLVITDLRMPEVDGLDLIRHVRANYRDMSVIMITGFASIESAVAAVKEGADNYLTKPFTDQELLAAVHQTLEKRVRQRHAERPLASPDVVRRGLIGDSPPMRQVFRAIEKAAAASATVLIAGESGTGKELVARDIHYAGPRASAPFVPVNCAGIPEGLVESELFGHIKGAFTGAITTRAGLFIAADGRSIFLDEVGELTPMMQGKLLRVLEDGQVQMVGGNRPRAVDVRVIAATNKDLRQLVAKKRFRDDLFYRLNVITIELPPLRERGDDINLLIRHFLAKFGRENGKPDIRISSRAWAQLQEYHWPGNVRELENVIQRLVVMADHDEIDTADLPLPLRFSVRSDGSTLQTLAQVEANHVRNVLASVQGNKTRAAEILGIDRKTLRECLKRTSGQTDDENLEIE